MLDIDGPFGWRTIEAAKLDAVRERLSHFESMTWHEILTAGKKQNHAIKVEQLSDAARKRLEEIDRDDIEGLVSLRIAGKERVWGIRDRDVLRLLWWDPEHRVYPSKQKGT